MTTPHFRTLVAATLIALLVTTSATAKETKSPVGRKVENFTLKDYRGKEHSLADYGDSKVIAIAILGTECPLVKLYAPRLKALAEEYSKKGVAFLAINANRQDSITEIAAYARRHELTFPILKDLGNRVADQLGAVRTPEVFLLDAKRYVRYHGRIDDQYGVGYIRENVSRRDLKIALDELLAGKKVSEPKTTAVGCYIGRIRKPDANATVTYSNQIARLIQKRCVECHREGEIAPFSLTKYEEVVGWAETIEEVMYDRRMPPWHADPKYSKFSNDRHVSSEELALISKWVAAGAPEGDTKDLPKPRTFVKGWQLPRKPDRVISMSDTHFTVPAEGVVRYQYMSCDPKFTEDKWVTAAQIVPGNREVVHHVLVFIRPPGGGRSPELGEFLVPYVPGIQAAAYPAGMAKRIPAGSKLGFQLHYTPIGSKQKDLTKVALVFGDPKTITHEIITTKAGTHRFDIPPHANNYEVTAKSNPSPVDVLLLGMMPHMHLRGKSFKYEAIFPDGRQPTLLDVPRYDFNWQTFYRLAKPLPLPAGTKMFCTAHFDNSAENLSNPDPTKTIRWGDQTWNEMMLGYFDIAVPRTPGKPKGNPRVQQLMRQFDKNRDGIITAAEVPAKLKPTFRLLDADKNGKLTVAELTKGLGG
jgi:peroxiredoxin